MKYQEKCCQKIYPIPGIKQRKENIMDIEKIAKVCHEVNRAYCVSIGDDSQLPWEKSPQWQKDSAINGVKFNIENTELGPDASHISWLEEKEKDGWKYGPVKDAEKKEHPCFVTYEELPPEQQAKDYIFRAVVHNLMDL